jgi:hypothetical protein
LQRSQLSKSLGRESVRALCLCGGRVQTSEQGRLHISCVLCLICRKFPEKHLWENSPRRCFLWGPGSAFKPPISEREKGGQLPCAKEEGYLVSPAYSNESTDPLGLCGAPWNDSGMTDRDLWPKKTFHLS